MPAVILRTQAEIDSHIGGWFDIPQPVSLDIETAPDGTILGVGLANAAAEVYLTGDQLMPLLKGIVRRSKVGFICHYGKSDFKALYRAGIYLTVAFDTYCAARLLHFDNRDGFSLKHLAGQKLGMPTTYDSPFGQMEWSIDQFTVDGQINVAAFSAEQVAEYCTRDARATWDLMRYFKAELSHFGMTEIHRCESALMSIVGLMELRGVPFSIPAMQAIRQDLEAEREALTSAIHAHGAVELSSNADISDYLYNRLGISTGGVSQGKSGRFSTNAENLARIAPRHPVVPLIVEWRLINTILTSYSGQYIDSALSHAGRVMTELDAFGADTGRFASSGVNLQNVPTKGRGIIVRRAFEAAAGWKIMSVDYQQLDIYALAVLASDKTMIDILRSGGDIHRETASAMYRKDPAAITKLERSHAKIVNFQLAFGAGVGSFRPFAASWDEAQAMYDRWMAKFHGVRDWQAQQYDYLARGYSVTWYGRMRTLPIVEPTEENVGYKRSIHRLAINGPVQGTESDIIKLAMVRVDRALRQRPALWPNCRMILQIHDELLFEVKDEFLAEATEVIRQAMQSVPFPVPLRVDVAVGQSWGDAAAI